MLQSLTVIIACLVIGEAARFVTGVPLPGPVIGMVLLLALLVFRRGPAPEMQQTGQGLLRNLALFYVPASVGLINELPRLMAQAGPIAAALLGSTVLGMAATALAMRLLSRDEP
ncbi:CidA/LrgA family protein [Starkeya koreensis]|uniref:CidA/LrgA family protein n=1 Tax=Ancylobacter koreensis TaxID=266121 RepID=A0ABT0DKA9_9HYPH|nr:CidA/LrgA family protein [Ancylobacter koreensis]MCK0207604.1 CidA/LrgA family protein [Ancylobacter koreensis]